MAKKNTDTLMALANQYNEVRSLAQDPEYDIDTVLDSIESMEGVLADKVNAYGFVHTDFMTEAAAQQARIDYLESVVKGMKDHLKAIKNRDENLKERLKSALIITGMDEEGIKTDMFTVKMVKNGGIGKLWLDEAKVPQEFMKKEVVYKPDQDKIREHLTKHVEDWARVLPTGYRVDIK